MLYDVIIGSYFGSNSLRYDSELMSRIVNEFGLYTLIPVLARLMNGSSFSISAVAQGTVRSLTLNI